MGDTLNICDFGEKYRKMKQAERVLFLHLLLFSKINYCLNNLQLNGTLKPNLFILK